MKKIKTNPSVRFLAMKKPSRLSMIGDKWSHAEYIVGEEEGVQQRARNSSRSRYSSLHRNWHTQLRRRDS
jgi:hypothetical protein